MKRPSTVVTLDCRTIQATPRRGTIPSTTESSSIIGSLSPSSIEKHLTAEFAKYAERTLANKSFLLGFILGPEAVAGAVNEDILERRLTDGDGVDFAGESLDHVG